MPGAPDWPRPSCALLKSCSAILSSLSPLTLIGGLQVSVSEPTQHKSYRSFSSYCAGGCCSRWPVERTERHVVGLGACSHRLDSFSDMQGLHASPLTCSVHSHAAKIQLCVPAKHCADFSSISVSSVKWLNQACFAVPTFSLHLMASAGSILELTRGECQQCKDVPRLCAAVPVLCQLVVCGKPVGSSTLQVLLSLTVNRYPKVRHLESLEPIGLSNLAAIFCSCRDVISASWHRSTG